jgi:hypothetical protein
MIWSDGSREPKRNFNTRRYLSRVFIRVDLTATASTIPDQFEYTIFRFDVQEAETAVDIMVPQILDQFEVLR